MCFVNWRFRSFVQYRNISSKIKRYRVTDYAALMADINNMGREKTRLSYTRKTNAPNSLCNNAV